MTIEWKGFLLIIACWVFLVWFFSFVVEQKRDRKYERQLHATFYKNWKDFKERKEKYERNYVIPLVAAREILDKAIELQKYIPSQMMKDYEEDLDALKTNFQKKVSLHYEEKEELKRMEKELTEYKERHKIKYIDQRGFPR